MGKKYIIEMEDKPVCVFDEDTQTFFPRLHRVKGFNSLVFDQNGLDKLTPYTEPDMEQVNAEKDALYDEARARGYDEGRARGYQEGLFDAWEAARKIILDKEDGGLDTVTYNEIFGYGKGVRTVLKIFTASEAIEKIRQYEQKQEQIRVGDEVITDSGKAVVMGVGPVHFEYVNADGSGFDEVKNVKKTGRHYPEIAEVLRKMKEGS